MTAFNKILIGIDNSKFSEHATKTGFDLAKQFGAAVGLVHIIEPAFIQSPVNDTGLGMPMDTSADLVSMEVLDVQNKISENIIDATIEKYGEGLEVTHFTDYGSTADGIINCSKEFGADLIVIGTHSRSGLDRLLMGSVAEHVVRHSDVPVLVVPLLEK
ncbi:universal stress protein [Mucilaginibacter agri]|uniref:Universal stress protein n=1 Tax=Mucilaginibacter agri TaxID=2695265 RepID=A0A965ZHY7_9SPHI|nr:universal stress protein [Mucilaginibacter agri]NCD70483.1 universal stress protein [Mucilaginibacter agri]